MVARTSRATIIEPASTAAGLSPRSRRGKRMRVLLVEPDAQYQSRLGTGLAEAGFEVAVVATAEDAREELSATHCLPQLVVAETELAGIDGFTFCNHLRADPRTAQLPVFLIASRRQVFHPELAASVGADDYLTKPLTAQDMVALARLMAGRRSGEAQYEAHSARLPLTDVARALLAGTRSGRVVLKEGDGFFAFRDGRVVDARFQGERGVLGFRRLLSFGSGGYGVTFGAELHRGSLLMDRAFLREQVLPGLERFEKLREVGVPLAARLTVDFRHLSEHLSELPDEVVALLRLFDGRRTVRAVLLDCQLPEVIAFETTMHLFVLGVLVPASHVEERERVQEAPRFLEPQAEAARVAREAQAREAEEREAAEHEARLEEALEAEAPPAQPQPEPQPVSQEPGQEDALALAAALEQASKEPELDLDIDVVEPPAAEEPVTRPPAPIILTFPKPAARRREEKAARARPVEVFQLASGETRTVR
ncbi:MAG: response regulator [Hyalangium sp.]|uniref:response regulator n=1 Tax=Hyalangium sp. TaxID=2028555 RepID=UPI003899A9EA